MRKTVGLLTIIASFISNGMVFGQQKLDAYFEHLFKNRKFMGSVAVSYHDSIIYSKSVGYADVNAERKIDGNTKFRIASITKTFTAVLVLKAVEEQKLHLDDKLSLYYPEVKNAAKISIEQMLNHRSGIFNFTEKPGEDQWQQHPHTEQEFVDFFVNEPASFEPGTSYAYSNTNYALLGFILEKIYHKSYAELLDEKICQPLHLVNTYYSFEVDSAKDEALSYNIQDRYIRNSRVNFSNHPGSGGIASNAVDLNKFLFALFNGKLISPGSLAKMLPMDKGEYGLGIEKLSFNSPEGFGHSGRLENYISDYWYFPKENLGIVTLANATNIDTDDIGVVLVKYAYGSMPELPDFNNVPGLSYEVFDSIRGTYYLEQPKSTITISSDGRNLVFQDSRSGQDFVPFEYDGNNAFHFGNIKLQFFPAKREVELEQDGIKVTYKSGTR